MCLPAHLGAPVTLIGKNEKDFVLAAILVIIEKAD